MAMETRSQAEVSSNMFGVIVDTEAAVVGVKERSLSLPQLPNADVQKNSQGSSQYTNTKTVGDNNKVQTSGKFQVGAAYCMSKLAMQCCLDITLLA
jgi:hypothetical protein